MELVDIKKELDSPLLSVIVPIYNVELYLERCLDSIIGQTYKNMQIICVDDGSTDQSGMIADRYAEIDTRIEVIHKENAGLVSARKCGIEHARGRYSTYVDSDDWIEPDMYQSLMELIVENNAEVVTSGAYRDYGTYIVAEDENVDSGVYEGEKLHLLKLHMVNTDVFFKNNVLPHLWNKIFLTVKLLPYQMQVKNTISIGEDVVVSYPVIFSSKKIVVSGKNYYHYCLRTDSVMGCHNVDDTDRINAVTEYLDESFSKFEKEIANVTLQADILKTYLKLFRNLKNTVKYKDGMMFPYGKIDRTDKVLVYGAGKFGKELFEFLKQQNWFENLIWADSDGKNGTLSVEQIDIVSFDKILIAVLVADISTKIRKELVKRGVDEDKILIPRLK